MLQAARRMARESQVLRNIASHVCPLSEIQIQCLNAKTHEWTDVDVAQRKKDARYEAEKYKKYDAIKPEQFVPDRYRFFLDSCGGTLEETAKEHKDMADKVAVYVKLVADRAEIKVEFLMSSRDVGYELCAMKSHMQSIITGEWLEKHHQYPTACQFDQVVGVCLTALDVCAWLKFDPDAE